MTIRSPIAGSALRFPWLAAAALAAVSPAMADVKAGVDAWSSGNYARAVKEWQVPADRGDADAQFNLAQAHKLGRGVPVDLAKAEDLFARAAAQGHLQAADNYGLLLFQRGERVRAMPYIKSAAERGDPRSQYLLGIAHFNGDNVDKDWVRAYALVSLAQQEGLAQAAPALAQMDNYIPIEQRRQSAALAPQLAASARATRERQMTAVDLAATVPAAHSGPPPRAAAAAPKPAAARTPAIVAADRAVATAAHASGKDGTRTAGADYARPQTAAEPARPSAAASTSAPAPAPAAKPAAKPKPKPAALVPAVAPSGAWRVQLGAFAVPGNTDTLWNRVKSRPEIAGRAKLVLPSGRVSRLLAGGFASQGDAQRACSRLSAAGFTCMPTRN